MTSVYHDSRRFAAGEAAAYRSPGAAMPAALDLGHAGERRRLGWTSAPVIVFMSGILLGAAIGASAMRMIER